MGLDDRAADGKSDPHAGLFRREEGLKQVGLDVIVETGAGVGHLDFDHVVGDLGVRCNKLALRRLRHRLQGIAEKIDQHLLDLDPIDQNQVEFRIEIEAKLDVLFAGARQTERAGLFDQFREASTRFSDSPRETKSRRRRMIWPARSACSAARSMAFSIFGALGSLLSASSRREPFI